MLPNKVVKVGGGATCPTWSPFTPVWFQFPLFGEEKPHFGQQGCFPTVFAKGRGGGVEKITFAVSFSILKRYFKTEVILHCLA